MNGCVGQTKIVLVQGQGAHAKAVFTDLTVRLRDDEEMAPLVYTGVTAFDEATKEHLQNQVYPLVCRIAKGLFLPPPRFAIAVTNPGAAAASDVGVMVSGFSADVPLFLAMLSCALGIPLPADTAATGHIASPEGAIRMVRSLPAKLEAGAREPGTERFIVPDPVADPSLETLTPQERNMAVGALARAKQQIAVITVAHIAELVQKVFSRETLAKAALQCDYFYTSSPEADPAKSPLEETLVFFLEDNPTRFWQSLEHALLSAHTEEVTALLRLWCRFHHRRGIYPHGFGQSLQALVQSVPPFTRRLSLHYPLCPREDAALLLPLCEPNDLDDVQQFLTANAGSPVAPLPPTTPAACANEATECPLLDTVLVEIAPEALAKRIGIPLDDALNGYLAKTVLIPDHDSFNDTVTAFYRHLMRHYGAFPADVDTATCAAHAIDLLARAFAREDGLAGARAEARDATQGGIRYVLDAMTDRLKHEEQEKHVNRVLAEALDTLDWDAKVSDGQKRLGHE